MKNKGNNSSDPEPISFARYYPSSMLRLQLHHSLPLNQGARPPFTPIHGAQGRRRRRGGGGVEGQLREEALAATPLAERGEGEALGSARGGARGARQDEGQAQAEERRRQDVSTRGVARAISDGLRAC